MYFAAIFVPDFPVQALVRAEPELRDQAIAVLEGTPPLSRVIACNEIARRAKVFWGQTKMEAEGRFQAAFSKPSSTDSSMKNLWKLRQRSPAQEAAAHAALLDCAYAFSPRVEDAPSAPDTIVLDLEGLERLFGAPANIAQSLARHIADMGLQANVATASTIEAAVHAAHGFAGITVIKPGSEAECLGSLPVRLLFCTEDASLKDKQKAEILDTLARWGITTFRTLAALPETALAQRLGQLGVHLQKLARGEDTRPLAPAEPPLHFIETAELEFPVALLEPLSLLLHRMLEQLCARLAARALSAQEIFLKLLLSPRESEREESAGAPEKDTREKSYVLRFPVPMLDTKTFLRLLQLELQARPPEAPVGKIVMSAEPVAPRFLQDGLFLPVTPEPQKLELMLARLRRLVERKKKQSVLGKQRSAEPSEPLYVGAAELLDTHRPDAFRMQRFSTAPRTSAHQALAPELDGDLPSTSPRSTGTSRPHAKQASRERDFTEAKNEHKGSRDFSSRTVLRRFRPPKQVNVRLENGRPTAVSFLPVTKARETNRTLPVRKTAGSVVLWAAGPWLESGEWWTPQPWSREVWDVALQQSGSEAVYRLFRDQAREEWFLDAEYD